MRRLRFEAILLAVLLAVFLFANHLLNPGNKLSQAEVDNYMSKLEQAPVPKEELAAMILHMRAWAEADDGKPVYMLNLMRYYPKLRALPEVASFQGSPAEANAYYEEHVMPILFALGAYPLFVSELQGTLRGSTPSTNLVTFDPAVDNWNSVLIVRYPSRAAFLELLTDPQYLKYLPYKTASVLVALAPMKGDLILPQLDWALGAGLLILFFAIAWLRALRRAA